MVFRGFVSNRNEENKSKVNKPVYLGLSVLEISKAIMYEFSYDYIKPNIKIMQKYATWIQIVLLFIAKLRCL